MRPTSAPSSASCATATAIVPSPCSPRRRQQPHGARVATPRCGARHPADLVADALPGAQSDGAPVAGAEGERLRQPPGRHHRARHGALPPLPAATDATRRPAQGWRSLSALLVARRTVKIISETYLDVRLDPRVEILVVLREPASQEGEELVVDRRV